jgi:hypothetical protein
MAYLRSVWFVYKVLPHDMIKGADYGEKGRILGHAISRKQTTTSTILSWPTKRTNYKRTHSA